MNPFDKRLEELCTGKNFLQLCLIKIIWSFFTSRKSIIFLISIVLFTVLIAIGKLDDFWLQTLVGSFFGANVIEKFSNKYRS